MSNTATSPDTKYSRLKGQFLFQGMAPLQSPAGRKLSKRHLLLALLVGVLDGLAVLTLIPLTNALSSGGSIASWLWLLLAIAVLAFALRFYSTMASYHTAIDFIRTAHITVGDKLTLPTGLVQFTAETVAFPAGL